MGFFDSKTKSESQTRSIDPYQLAQMTSRLGTLGSTPMEFFPEQTYAGLDPRQTEALEMREQYARGMGGMVDPTMQAWRGMLTAPDVAQNPYVQGMLEQQADIAGRSFREALPGIESSAIAAGQFGGSRQGVVEALRERGLREALAQSAAQTQLDAYQQGLAQQRYGLEAAPGMMSLGMRPAQELADIGAFYRGEDQRAIDEAMARHQFEQEEPWRRLERQAGLFQPLTLPYAETEQERTEKASGAQKLAQGIGLFSSLTGALTGGLGNVFGANMPMGTMPQGTGAGGYGGAMSPSYAGGAPSSFMPMSSFGFQGAGGAGAGLAGGGGLTGGGGAMSMLGPMMAMFSDRRLKSNIVHIGYTPGGQRVYEYEIFGRQEIGVMAQESPPEAVIRHPSGYLMVDYSRIR